MNFITVLFGLVTILLHVQKIFGGEVVVRTYRNKYAEPLGLIQQNNSLKLKLAIPYRVNGVTCAADYSYEDTTETFKTACPAFTNQQTKIEKKWRKKAHATKTNLLYFLVENNPANSILRCQRYETSGPSIQKTDRECGQPKGEIYEVGYPVSNEDGTNIQFVVIYEICYSKNKKDGMIYTKHRIDSPSLLLLKVYEIYEPRWASTFKSPSKLKLKNSASAFKKKRVYQFVPKHDMPTILWQDTTLFPFNYIPLGPYQKYENILKGMLKYDNVVRLFSKQTNKPLTIYSGTYQSTFYRNDENWLGRTTLDVLFDSFWRVIIDSENKATILITQYTRKTCIEKTSMCYRDYTVLEMYPGGGCTYTCTLTVAVMEMLRIPNLEIAGKLDIAYTPTDKSESNSTPQVTEGQSDANAQSSGTQVDISKFGGGLSFAAALLVADPATAEIMRNEGVFETVNDAADSSTDGDDDTNHAEGAIGRKGRCW